MADPVQIYKLIELIRNNDRVAVRRAQEDNGLSTRSIYRPVEQLRGVPSVRIENGVIVREQKKELMKLIP